MPRRILLTDVDNTLFSWIDFFAPCFRSLVHAVSRASGIGEDALYDAFQITFKQEGSVEYRRAIQDNLAVRELPQARQDEVVELGAKVFGMNMRRHLRPYDGVKATLERLKSDGVLIVAVTNSGALQAVDRLRRLGLAKLIHGLVAWDHDVAQIADATTEYAVVLRNRTRRSGIPWTIPLATEKLKPSSEAYLTALRNLGLRESDEIWVIGDSMEKDLLSVPEIRGHSIWAKYGHAFDERNFETLLRITHWSREKIQRAYDSEILTPDAIVDSFEDVLGLLKLRQGELF